VYNAETENWENGNPNATVFGSSFYETSDDTFASNGSSAWQEYLSLSALQDASGAKYRIGVFVVWGISSTSDDFEARLQVTENGSTITVGILAQEAKDDGTDQKIASSGFFYYTSTTSGTLKIDMDFRPESDDETAYVHYAGIEFWRVS